MTTHASGHEAPSLGWRALLTIWLATGVLFGLVAQAMLGATLRAPATWLTAIAFGLALGAGAVAGRALPTLARRIFP